MAINKSDNLRTDLAASSGSSLIGFIQSGAGAVARAEQDKLRDVVNVKDFGAVGDGTTDDTAAVDLTADNAKSFTATGTTLNATPPLGASAPRISTDAFELDGGF
ncbi:MAG: hypothetical protein ACKO96_26440, partial [Flammeovirgaceae bacterium]